MKFWRSLLAHCLLLLLSSSLTNGQDINQIKLQEIVKILTVVERIDTKLEAMMTKDDAPDEKPEEVMMTEVIEKLNQLESKLTLIPGGLQATMNASLDEAESRIRLELEDDLKCSCNGASLEENLKGVPFPVKVSNYRYISYGSVVDITKNIHLKQCGSLCHLNADCVSFNYIDVSQICELLNTAPYKKNDLGKVVSDVWKHYVFVAPKTNDKDVLPLLCPAGSFVVWYDQPIYAKYDPSLPGYTCTNHPWVKEQYANGLTDCRMVIQYDLDFGGYDTAYAHVPATYSDSLKKCSEYGCVGMICRNNPSDFRCWLKHSTHLTSSGSVSDYVSLVYWYTVCT